MENLLFENLMLVEGVLVDFDFLVEARKKARKKKVEAALEKRKQRKAGKKEVDYDDLIRTTKTRTIDEPEDELHKKFYAALHSNVLDVWFTKKNKRYRRLRCTLNPDLIPPEKHGKGIVDRSGKHWFMNVYDLRKKDWRTFRLDYVDKIRHVKQVEFPQYNAKIFT